MVKRSRRIIRRKIELKGSRQPGYNIIRHPRYLNKPLACQSGLHRGLQVRIINGIPSLYCKKCGEFIGKGIHDKTWSKRDMEKILEMNQKQTKERTKEEIMKEAWKKHQLTRSQRRRRMEESIRKHVKKRMDFIQ